VRECEACRNKRADGRESFLSLPNIYRQFIKGLATHLTVKFNYLDRTTVDVRGKMERSWEGRWSLEETNGKCRGDGPL
jgi:hypothetical protein